MLQEGMLLDDTREDHAAKGHHRTRCRTAEHHQHPKGDGQPHVGRVGLCRASAPGRRTHGGQGPARQQQACGSEAEAEAEAQSGPRHAVGAELRALGHPGEEEGNRPAQWVAHDEQHARCGGPRAQQDAHQHHVELPAEDGLGLEQCDHNDVTPEVLVLRRRPQERPQPPSSTLARQLPALAPRGRVLRGARGAGAGALGDGRSGVGALEAADAEQRADGGAEADRIEVCSKHPSVASSRVPEAEGDGHDEPLAAAKNGVQALDLDALALLTRLLHEDKRLQGIGQRAKAIGSEDGHSIVQPHRHGRHLLEGQQGAHRPAHVRPGQ
mmetsp:Transcript_96415/g.281761  ORF Transcript_96415/g.281761 Transcript_96415/m.281761 type:complete len:326 (+) Transcript_96415:502-1479(+)